MVLKESLAYYVYNQSSGVCTFWTRQVTFDGIRYRKLFRLLLSRHVPAPIVRIFSNF